MLFEKLRILTQGADCLERTEVMIKYRGKYPNRVESAWRLSETYYHSSRFPKDKRGLYQPGYYCRTNTGKIYQILDYDMVNRVMFSRSNMLIEIIMEDKFFRFVGQSDIRS